MVIREREMDDFTIEIVETKANINSAKIRVIGVGGGGGNMIDHMLSIGTKGIDMMVSNTDAQALLSSQALTKIQLGVSTTRGLGAGMIPMIGRESALENFDELKEHLEGSDIVFISAGLGGGTGTGAAPIIAQAAKEVGALTVAVVTTPFKFEGKKRTKLAKAGLEELKEESDCVIVIPNEKLLSIVEKNLGLKESFKLVDNILSQAVSGISNLIISHGENDINLDFADVKTTMDYKGLALIGTGYSDSGTNAAYDAALIAVDSPLLDDLTIDGAMGILVHFDINPDYPILGISAAMDMIEDRANEDANVIFGTSTNQDMSIEEVKITIIATGFEKEKEEITSVNPIKKPKVRESYDTTTDSRVFDDKKVVGLDIPSYYRIK